MIWTKTDEATASSASVAATAMDIEKTDNDSYFNPFVLLFFSACESCVD